MAKPLNILLIEDSEDDAALLRLNLTGGGLTFEDTRVDSADGLRGALDSHDWDIVLCDYDLSQLDAFTVLATVRDSSVDASFIVVSGMIGEAKAAELMRAGARDVLSKDRLTRLVPAIERELAETDERRRRRRAESALRESEALLKALFDHAPAEIVVKGLDGRYEMVNQSMLTRAARTMDEARGKTVFDFFPRDVAEESVANDKTVLATGEVVVNEQRVVDDGAEHIGQITRFPIKDAEGRITRIGVITRDVTREKRAEAILKGYYAVFELLAAGESLEVVLTKLIDVAESVQPGLIGSVLLADPVERRLRHGVAPGLPDFYNQAIDGLEIGAGIGVCGTAAFTGKRVVVEDILEDPNCAAYHDIATRAELRACWSQPIIGSKRDVLGTFALYYRAPKAPDADAIELMESAAHLASIAIEHVREQEVRRKNEAMLREAERMALIASWEWDEQQGRMTWTSEQYGPLHGFPADTPPKTLEEYLAVIHPDDRDTYRRMHDETKERPRAHELEYRIVRPDGEVRYLHLRSEPEFDSRGRLLRYHGFDQDITELRRAEAALRQSEERLRAVIDNAPGAIFFKDLDGRYRLVNKRFEEWYGASAEDAFGKTSHDVFPREYADRFVAQDREALVTGTSVAHELETPFADGSLHHIIITKFPVFDAGGTPIGVATVNTDVTEQRAVEAQLQQAQKMEAVGQLTGGVAHDFNNLLTVVLGNLQLLERRLGDDEKQAKFLRAAMSAALRGGELSKRLLAFARRQVLEPTTTDVRALVADMSDLLHRSLGEAVDVETAMAADLWTVYVDRGQLETAILNLAINARDAMPNGGKLTIGAANVTIGEADETNGAALAGGDYVALKVTDRGTGISLDVIARVLEPFFTTKDVGKGTGLGLSMVYGFVKQSGGDVLIESEPGAGTTVTLYLPRASGADAALPAAGLDADAVGGDERVLVVEDDDAVRDIVVALLRDLGYRVTVATNGPEALSLIDGDQEFDLMLTDVIMPGGINGIALARQVRKRRPRLKVLFSSGYTDDAFVREGVGDERIDLIGKPYRKEELARKIREVLGRDDADDTA